MDKKRKAAWKSAILNVKRGEEVSPEDHYSLLRQGMFEGLNEGDRRAEAKYVVRYWLHGRDLLPIERRGPAEADNWFALGATWGKDRQAEKLRVMIDASGKDYDYWKALNLIAARLLRERRLFPEDLTEWAIKVFEGRLTEPKRPRGDSGRPHYAHDARNHAAAEVFLLLLFLGLKKSDAYVVISDEFGVSDRTVMKAIKAATEADGRFPGPWECWPPPPKS